MLPNEIIIRTDQLDLRHISKNIIKDLNIKFFFQNKKSNNSKNIAIKNSSSDYILQIDDDVTIKKFFLNLSKYVHDTR